MSFALECKKVKRTGFLPAFLGGGIIAAAVPVVNMTVRSETFIGMDASPVNILLGANWQLIAMLNVLLVIVGACIMYNNEYADNAIQRMCTLPTEESTIFFGKAAVMIAVSIMVVVIEAISIFFCAVHWFESSSGLYIEVLKNFGLLFMMMLPAIILSLLIASACKNMWISLGVGVICVLVATMLPTKDFVWSLFPFSLPFQTLSDKSADVIRNYAIASSIEIAVLAILETVFLKVRRSFA